VTAAVGPDHHEAGADAPDEAEQEAEGDAPEDEAEPDAADDDAADSADSASGDDFASRVVAVVETIPSAHVMTYGSVAAAVGSRSSRGVGRVMAHAGSELPWWRVVRASGLAPQGHEQRALEQYRVEGTPLRWSRAGTFRVDLTRASWWPAD
jgi:alkylated DNA nucleotide flippase Atl1